MLDGTIGRTQIVVEHEVLVGKHLAARSRNQRTGIEIEVGSVVARTSQPRPIVTAVRFGASFESETFPPLAKLTPIPVLSIVVVPPR